MNKKEEMIEKMKGARSWKETGISLQEMLDMLKDELENNTAKPNSDMDKLKSKVERLTESNKQLMAENKKLRGNK